MMYNIKKSPKEIFILFRGKFLEDIVKITLKKSKKSAIMAKGSGIDSTTARIRGHSSKPPHIHHFRL